MLVAPRKTIFNFIRRAKVHDQVHIILGMLKRTNMKQLHYATQYGGLVHLFCQRYELRYGDILRDRDVWLAVFEVKEL